MSRLNMGATLISFCAEAVSPQTVLLDGTWPLEDVKGLLDLYRDLSIE